MSRYCCSKMERSIDIICKLHKNPFNCPDAVIWYDMKYDEYGLIIHDGGESYIEINYCPWCGNKLPESKRDLWFDTLEKLGFEDPIQQDIPIEFETDDWYIKRKLG